jgi:putative ABC transport system substrate-binding protein
LVALAQQAAGLPVVGYLYSGSAETSAAFIAAFRKGLSEAGLVDGWQRGDLVPARADRLPQLAAELVRRRVAIAAPGSLNAALAAKAATTIIPVVFQTGGDPVQTGLVASFNRPGHNATGFTSMNNELQAKRLELFHELLPATARFAVLIDPTGLMSGLRSAGSACAWYPHSRASTSSGRRGHKLSKILS